MRISGYIADGVGRIGYTSMVGVSDESDTIPRGAASGAYSTRRRVIAYSPGVRR